MKILEAINSKNESARIFLGDVAKRLYNGQHGELLRALISGRIQGESVSHIHEKDFPADRALGRIEAYQTIIDDIEQLISDAEILRLPQREDEPEYQQGADPG